MWRSTTQRSPYRAPTDVKAAALVLSLIVSAYVTVLALGNSNCHRLVFVALLPLFASVCVCRPQAAMGCGALWGFSLHLLSAKHRMGDALGYVLAASLVAFINAGLVSALSRVTGGTGTSRCLPGREDTGHFFVLLALQCPRLSGTPALRPRAPPVRPVAIEYCREELRREPLLVLPSNGAWNRKRHHKS